MKIAPSQILGIFDYINTEKKTDTLEYKMNIFHLISIIGKGKD
jgi:hypothetical protein